MTETGKDGRENTMFQKIREKRRLSAERQKLLDEFKTIRTELECAYEAFDRETDPGLTDAHIYEISALRARYNHACQALKQHDL